MIQKAKKEKKVKKVLPNQNYIQIYEDQHKITPEEFICYSAKKLLSQEQKEQLIEELKQEHTEDVNQKKFFFNFQELFSKIIAFKCIWISLLIAMLVLCLILLWNTIVTSYYSKNAISGDPKYMYKYYQRLYQGKGVEMSKKEAMRYL